MTFTIKRETFFFSFFGTVLITTHVKNIQNQINRANDHVPINQWLGHLTRVQVLKFYLVDCNGIES